MYLMAFWYFYLELRGRGIVHRAKELRRPRHGVQNLRRPVLRGEEGILSSTEAETVSKHRSLIVGGSG